MADVITIQIKTITKKGFAMLKLIEMKHRMLPVFIAALFTSGAAFADAAASSVAPASDATQGTSLVVTNDSNATVRVMITLGANNGISSVSQLPQSWNVSPGPGSPPSPLLGSFYLKPHQSTAPFNSGSKTFSGNISFGPSWTATGCGGKMIPNTKLKSCYPNATSLGEFSLNMGSGGMETVDISGVNGTNAKISMKLTGKSQWNDGAGNHPNVTTIANVALPGFKKSSGVYGWAATNCTTSQNPPTNPPNPNMTNCPAPVDAPKSHKPQLQKLAQCNVQRATGAQTGGTVTITFHGYTRGSTPPKGCAGSAQPA